MIFLIDITESFGAIDFDNVGGIATYINIPPQEDINNRLRLDISNFILNLIDEPVIFSLNNQDPEFLKRMAEDGFLIINKATIAFENIKGHERLLRLKGQDHGYLIHEAYGHSPENNDKIYELSGLTHSTPELIMNFVTISPTKVTLEFDSLDHLYVENYENFIESIPLINSRAKKPQAPLQCLFDANFCNQHTIGNFETGYSTYKNHH